MWRSSRARVGGTRGGGRGGIVVDGACALGRMLSAGRGRWYWLSSSSGIGGRARVTACCGSGRGHVRASVGSCVKRKGVRGAHCVMRLTTAAGWSGEPRSRLAQTTGWLGDVVRGCV